MTTDRVGKVLEKVAHEAAEPLGGAYLGIQAVLEERLGPLLRAGQAMRDWDATDSAHNGNECIHGKAWDAALDALERPK